MSHKLIWEPKGVYWNYYGKVSGKEIIETSTAIYGDPRFDELRYKLVDFLDVETVDVDHDEVAQIAYLHRAAALSNLRIKNAIVIKSNANANALELVNEFSAFFSDSSWEVQVFHSLDEANDWLGRMSPY
jgi:hypothetical protein